MEGIFIDLFILIYSFLALGCPKARLTVHSILATNTEKQLSNSQ